MSGNVRYSAPTRRLPAHPNLEQLRKQAKDLLEEYRAGLPTALAEVQRFERHPGEASFALADAQRVLARAYGYDSWSKLKAFVDGVCVARLTDAVKSGNIGQVRDMLATRPELVGMDMNSGDEHRALHYAVLGRDVSLVRLLMQSGADARKGIWPHRDATSALAIARDREYDEVVAVIEEEETRRRKQLSCPNAIISPVQDRISDAISEGDTSVAIRLLDAEPLLIHACDRHGSTPLHLAAEEAETELVAWLLKHNANVQKQNSRGLTPLDCAALSVDPRAGNVQSFPEIANLLLQHGAAVTVRAAVALGEAARVRELVLADLDLLRQIDSGGGLLTLAVKHAQIRIVELLLDLGADVDERTVLQELEEPTPTWGMPLWWAALAGDLEITRLLLDHGADPNANVYASGWPLRNAWHHKDESVKRLLLERGARLQPYMIAETHNVAEAKLLVAGSPDEETTHELLWSAADNGCPEIVQLALPHINWPRTDPRWHWVLIQPARGAGANPAANEGHFRALAAVLEHGVDPNVRRFGQTPLHFVAAHHGPVGDLDRARFASMLLDHGARLDLRDDLLQSTPLGWACRWGRRKMVELLIERGAPVEEPEAQPWACPKAWARKMKYDDILAILERH